jgi:hypothetical protein
MPMLFCCMDFHSRTRGYCIGVVTSKHNGDIYEQHALWDMKDSSANVRKRGGSKLERCAANTIWIFPSHCPWYYDTEFQIEI